MSRPKSDWIFFRFYGQSREVIETFAKRFTATNRATKHRIVEATTSCNLPFFPNMVVLELRLWDLKHEDLTPQDLADYQSIAAPGQQGTIVRRNPHDPAWRL